MVEILALVLHHDEQAVLMRGRTRALKPGVPTKMHVLNVLHRLTRWQAALLLTINAPQALRLVNEPQANVLPCSRTRCAALARRRRAMPTRPGRTASCVMTPPAVPSWRSCCAS